MVAARTSGDAWEDNDLVFPNGLGKPINPPNLLIRSFHPLLAKVNLPRVRFHDLRHTAASLLLDQGIHPKIVSEMLGHSTVSITLDPLPRHP
jgi:integrase